MNKFDDAAKMLPPIPVPEYDPRFIEASHAVASGRMTVDEAWEWLNEKPVVCPDCGGAGTLGRAADGRLYACENCGGHEDAAGTGYVASKATRT